MKKPTEKAKGKQPAMGVCPDKRMMDKCPRVVEYLTTCRWDDGTPRERSTITLFVEEGKVKAALNDREMKRSLYVSSDTLEDVLGALEEGLADEGADWRVWKTGKK